MFIRFIDVFRNTRFSKGIVLRYYLNQTRERFQETIDIFVKNQWTDWLYEYNTFTLSLESHREKNLKKYISLLGIKYSRYEIEYSMLSSVHFPVKFLLNWDSVL